MDFNQILSKDLFFLTQSQKNPHQFGGVQRIAKRYQQSRRSYLRRLENKPIVVLENHLPIADNYKEIKKIIIENQVVIICGETGSGKTTQLPKICLELNRGISGMIAHSQPRRIAARAVATRIAEELNCNLGKEVGYKIRFQDKTSQNTYIKIMTDGMLLSEIQSDRYLYAYDTIIIDEAHERSLNIDFLLGYLKKIVNKRKDLKIIITSATINAKIFSEHFQQAPIINILGRTFPIEVRYRPLKTNDENEVDISLAEAIFDAINELWQQESGDVLVFLPGEREIIECSEFLRASALKNIEILPLFSRLSLQEQQKIFKPKVLGKRIILTTNIAETSLTVPGIKYVIDSGQARIKRYIPRAKVEQLNIEKISQAAAKQRMGRCGRTSKGICIRLYSEEDYLARSEFTDPEIVRSNLAHVILMMYYLKLGNIDSFPFINSPEQRLIKSGVHLLSELGALNQAGELTQLGKDMAKIPLDPQFSRILLAAKEYDCVYEILVIVSALSIKDPREETFESRENARKAHKKFSDPNSDFLGFVYLWHFFQSFYRQRYSNRQLLQLSKENFLSYLRMREWRDFFKQLKQIVLEMGFRVLENGELGIETLQKRKSYHISYERIHRALISGLATNIGTKSIDGNHYINVRGSHFYIFPTSSLYKKKSKWIITSELMETSRLYARNNALIEPEWIERELKYLVKYQYTEPKWSSKRGEVIANEKVLLYGLTIIAKRTVSFGKINQDLSREIFIKDGLIAGDLDLALPFYQNNGKVIAQIKELENQERKLDFLLEDILFAFYNERLPNDIFGLASLFNWIKQDAKINNTLLSFSLDDLISQKKQFDIDIQFPKSLNLDNMHLPLSYRFELNHPMDGVTLQLPLPLLNKIDAVCLEWLVPGMIREKLHLLIKALPKNIRQICIPVSDFITEFLLSNPDTSRSIISQLVSAIGKKAGNVGIISEDVLKKWQAYPLPDYCYMNIQVIDDKGDELAMGRCLAVIQNDLCQAAQNSFRKYGDNQNIERHNITCWDIGDISSEIKFFKDYQQLIGYLALCPSQQNGISLKIFDTQESAYEVHQQGVVALMKLQLKEQIREISKGLLDFHQIVLLLRGIYASDTLKQEVVQVICQQAFIAEDQLPRDEESFKLQLQKAKNRLPETKVIMNRCLLETATAYYELKLEGHVLKEVIERQLSRLIYPGFILNTPWNIWPRLPFYLKSMELRLNKYSNNPGLDNQREQQVQLLEQQLYDLISQLKQGKKVVDKRLIDYRWKLEEFRISLFSQELKTPYPVSLKRLQKEWQELTKTI